MLALSVETQAIARPEKAEPTERGASLRSGVFNLANTILGAGMLGLPYAFAQCGLGMGLLLLLTFAFFSALGLYLLAAAADISGRPASFRVVAERALPGSGLLIDIAIAIKCFGVATSYLIVIGDSMPLAMPTQAPNFLLDRRFWSAFATICIAPLTFFEKLDALRFTSLVALLCILFITLIVVVFSLEPSTDPYVCAATNASSCESRAGSVVALTDGMSILHALPIFIFAFTCHQNIISITNELDRPTKCRMTSVIVVAEGLALFQYIAIGLAGYLTFGNSVRHDVLQSYPPSPLVSAARVMIAVVVALSYPLQSHPTRVCVLSILGAAKRHSSTMADGSANTLAPLNSSGGSRFAFVGVTCAFLAGTLVTALTVDDLSKVLSVVGATGSTIVSYLLPGLCFFCLCRDPFHPLRYLALLQLLLGVVLMPLSITLIFFK